MMQEFVYTLTMVQASYRQLIQKEIKDLGIDLSIEMLQVMRYLHDCKSVNQQVLANQIYKDKSSLSYLLSSMEKKSLIFRIEDQADKRNKLIYLTQEGKTLCNEIKKGLDSIYEKIEQKLDRSQVKDCIENMQKISKIISE